MTGDDDPMMPNADPPSLDAGAAATTRTPPLMADDLATVAPGLGRVAAFVNTADIESGADDLAAPDGLRAWLGAAGLPGAGDPLADVDAARAREIREAIRDLLAANAGHGLHAASLERLDRESRLAPLGLAVGTAGALGLRPLAAGLDAALATIFGDIATAVANGSWPRLKVCRSETCQYAYIDESKNGSRQWCSMAVCGNRMKGRAYRRRARSAGAG